MLVREPALGIGTARAVLAVMSKIAVHVTAIRALAAGQCASLVPQSQLLRFSQAGLVIELAQNAISAFSCEIVVVAKLAFFIDSCIDAVGRALIGSRKRLVDPLIPLIQQYDLTFLWLAWRAREGLLNDTAFTDCGPCLRSAGGCRRWRR